MSDLSPIERLIDAACQPVAPLPVHARLTEDEERLVDTAAASILYHIDQMYPAMWQGVPKTARTSVRNTIKEKVGRALIEARQFSKS